MDPFRNDKMMQMQAEMARFENEIAGRFMRPQMALPMGPGASLRFIPHAVRRGPGAQYPPPMGLTPHMLNAPQMFQHQPRMPSIPSQSSGSVIEGAPTRYSSISQSNASSSAVISAPPTPAAPSFDVEAAKKKMAAERAGVPTGSASASNKQTPAYTPLDAAKSFTMKHQHQHNHPQQAQATTSKGPSSSKNMKPKKYVRTAGGEVWEDPSLLEWDPNDFRLFCGDLGNEVSDELLAKAFRKYPSFQKAKVIREKRTNKTKGFGFVSFKDPQDFIRALREMDGKYVGNRPIKLRKSAWRDRNINSVRKKEKEKKKLGLKL